MEIVFLLVLLVEALWFGLDSFMYAVKYFRKNGMACVWDHQVMEMMKLDPILTVINESNNIDSFKTKMTF